MTLDVRVRDLESDMAVTRHELVELRREVAAVNQNQQRTEGLLTAIAAHLGVEPPPND